MRKRRKNLTKFLQRSYKKLSRKPEFSLLLMRPAGLSAYQAAND